MSKPSPHQKTANQLIQTPPDAVWFVKTGSYIVMVVYNLKQDRLSKTKTIDRSRPKTWEAQILYLFRSITNLQIFSATKQKLSV